MKNIFVMILVLLLLTSGCSYTGADIQDLMTPPKVTGDEANIQKIISESADNKNYIFKYPQRGNYRSAVIMYDIDADGQNEAIAFYKLDYLENTDINIIVMDQEEGEWYQLATFQVPALDIDKVSFNRIYNDESIEIIIGYSVYNNSTNNKMLVLKYDAGNIKLLDLNYIYSDFITMDFDSDKLDEILLLSLSEQNKPAVARLIKYSDISSKLENIGQTQIDSTVIKYVSFSSGFIEPDQPGVIIDSGKAENTIVSEIIYWDKKRSILEAPLSMIDSNNFTERLTKTTSRDVDGDGILDIPITFTMMGYTSINPDVNEGGDAAEQLKKDPVCYITQWSDYDIVTGGFTTNNDMVINEYYDYYICIPQSWEKSVTGKIDFQTNSLTFSEWVINEAGIGAAGSAILKIKVFDNCVWEAGLEDSSEFTELSRENGRVYAVSILQPDNPNAMTLEQIKSGFGLKSFGLGT